MVPSSYNGQPWRFLYALRETENWDLFFGLLVESNQRWAVNAGAIIVIVSRTTFEITGKPSRTHAFDTGAAWGYLVLQGSMCGLVVHGMEGFDYEAPDGVSRYRPVTKSRPWPPSASQEENKTCRGIFSRGNS